MKPFLRHNLCIAHTSSSFRAEQQLTNLLTPWTSVKTSF